MNKSNSIEAIGKTNLTNQTKFQLDEISKIENYFIEEINQRKSCSKALSKYVAAFDYIDKILIVLSPTTGGVSICSFTSIFGAPVGIASAIFTLFFSLTAGITKKLLSTTKKKERKSMIKFFMLAKSKLNSIETLISQALIDMEISHAELITILKEKDKYEKMKDNLKSKNEKYKIMRLISVKSKTYVKNIEYFMPSKKKIFSCICIKCFKSAKKNTKNVKLKLLIKELKRFRGRIKCC